MRIIQDLFLYYWIKISKRPGYRNFKYFKEKLSKLIAEKKIYLNLTKDIVFDKNIIDQNDKVNFIKNKKIYDVEGIIKSDFIDRYELNYEI